MPETTGVNSNVYDPITFAVVAAFFSSRNESGPPWNSMT